MVSSHEPEKQNGEMISPEYWLSVCRGMEAAMAWMRAADHNARLAALMEYPALAMPEFPSAIEALARIQETPAAVQACSAAARHLARMHEQLSRKEPQLYAAIMTECAIELAKASQGDPRRNLLRAIDIHRETRDVFSPDRPSFAVCLMNEGVVRQRLAGLGVDVQRNLEEAARLYARASTIFPAESPEFAGCLVNAGHARRSLAKLGMDVQGNLEEALRLYGQARATYSPDSSDFAICLWNEGEVRQQFAALGVDVRGNLEEAVRLYTWACTIFSPDSSDFAFCLRYEGVARESLAELGVDVRGSLEEALRLYAQARTIFLPDSLDFANCLVNEGITRHKLARLSVNSRTNLEVAVRLFGEARLRLPRDTPVFANSLQHEGIARSGLADLGVEARTNLELAVRLYVEARAIFSPKGSDFAQCLANEGIAYVRLAQLGVEPQRNLEAALRLFDEARAIFPSNSVHFAKHLVNAGTARASLAELGVDSTGHLEQALRLYREAASQLQSVGSPLDAMEAYGSLGRLALRLEDWEQARDGFSQAIQALEDVRATSLLIRDRQAWMDNNISLYKGIVEACLRLERYEEALEYVERGRSRALLDLLSMEDLTPRHVPPEKAEAYKRMMQRAEELEASLARQDGGAGGPADEMGLERLGHSLLQRKAEVSQRLRVMEEELRRLDPDFFTLAKPLAVPAMRALARDLDRTLVILWVGPQQGAAFCIGSSGEVDRVALPGVTDAEVWEWMLGPGTGTYPSGWMGAYMRYKDRDLAPWGWMDEMDRTLVQVYECVVKPVHRWLQDHGERRAAFVVAGSLGLLPLHAASWKEDGRVRYLIDDIEIVYAPSAWVLQRSARRRREAWAPVLGIGDPHSESLPPLPFGKWEVERIGAMVRNRGGQDAFDERLGEAATVERIAADLPEYAVSHFACHGLWNLKEPLLSALMMRGDGRLMLADLLRQTRLEKARLVVLSACESSPGFSPVSGEEFLGLPAGFIFAGAKSVVGSLWSVPDASTALLMIRMYEHLLKDRMGVADALRQAQLWLRGLSRSKAKAAVEETADPAAPRLPEEHVNKFKNHLPAGEQPFAHPYYWAAFQALGSPDPIA